MLRVTIILVLAVASTTVSAIAQSAATPTPSPTPKQPARRPSLDQFGLSSGVFASSSSSGTDAKGNASSASLTKEYVDADTFEMINVVIDKSAFMEAELNRVLAVEPGIDLSPGAPFTKYFLHHMVGLSNVSAVQREGTYGGQGIKSGRLTNLLKQNEGIVSEMAELMSVGAKESPDTKQLAANEKSSVPLRPSTSDGILVDKAALLKAMMSRINSNYALVKQIMAVRK
jgi:hypothetical protein